MVRDPTALIKSNILNAKPQGPFKKGYQGTHITDRLIGTSI